MTLGARVSRLLNKEYNEIDPELLDMGIRELKASDLCPECDESWKVDPFRNVFTRTTIGVVLYTGYDNMINIRFDEELFDNIEALRRQSETFKA